MRQERLRSAAIVGALSRAEAYPTDEGEVERIDTHMSAVFLVGEHAYKLKKPMQSELLDHGDMDARRQACMDELELNRRLAPEVYLDVVAVASQDGELRVGAPGVPVAWMVKMRRLPRDRMLDSLIERNAVPRQEALRAIERLIPFYHHAEVAGWTADEYRLRLEGDIADKELSLSRPRYGLPLDRVREIAGQQRAWIHDHSDLLAERARAVVHGHGDLRPEHICLERDQPPHIIDCLEFDRELRMNDPFSELSFLALECRRLGAADLGRELLDCYARESGDQPPQTLISFYQSRHAMIRATIAVWHLDDENLTHSRAWTDKVIHYFDIAEALL